MTRLEVIRELLKTVRTTRQGADTEAAAELMPVEVRLARREKVLARAAKPGRRPQVRADVADKAS